MTRAIIYPHKLKPQPPREITMQMCEGCGRVSHGRSEREWCPDTDRKERQIDYVYRLPWWRR